MENQQLTPAQRDDAIQRVAEFLKANYPCSCEEDCGYPDMNEAEAIIEIVEGVLSVARQ